MSRQYKNGTCSCWKKVEANIAPDELAVSFNFAGHIFLRVATEGMNDRRKKTKQVLCSYCPFCGEKLKEAKE